MIKRAPKSHFLVNKSNNKKKKKSGAKRKMCYCVCLDQYHHTFIEEDNIEHEQKLYTRIHLMVPKTIITHISAVTLSILNSREGSELRVILGN